MSFSDVLSLVEIGITILFGYYITHKVTIRDTQTRIVKDLYIGRLNDIKLDVDKFFDELMAGKLDGRKIADWYGLLQDKFISFDNGLRLALPIRKRKIEEVINDVHETITGSEYYNDHFKDTVYIVDKQERMVMNELRANVNKSLNEYLIQINNVRKYYVWETIHHDYLFELDYLSISKAKYPKARTIGKIVLKFIPSVVLLVIISFGIRGVSDSFRDNKASLEDANAMTLERMTYILDRISSIDMSLQKTSLELEKLTILDSNIVKIEIKLTNTKGDNELN